MKKLVLIFSFISVIASANIPDRVGNNIESESIQKDNRVRYIKEQERAYKRTISFGEKNGLSLEKIDEIIRRLEGIYGKNYEVIYKKFLDELKENLKNVEVKEKIKIENEKAKIEYIEIIEDQTIPVNIKSYIDKKATEKYPNDYKKRVEFSESLIEFYNFLKK